MKVVENPEQAYAMLDHWRRQELRVGLVPTMGALHEGHYSLVRRSCSECDITAATIFVNPAQFGPGEDLDRYPRTLEADLSGLQKEGVDLVFVPKKEALYPSGYSTVVQPPASGMSLEGVHRPGHFEGVVTIVLKLFHILPATVAYFGEKDYQQLTVIRDMVEDLNVAIRIESCATVREADGLAMSSRNRYLSVEERKIAAGISRALRETQQRVSEGMLDVAELERAIKQGLSSAGIERWDYACIVDSRTLQPMEKIGDSSIALIAAWVGKTRLIDNQRLQP